MTTSRMPFNISEVTRVVPQLGPMVQNNPQVQRALVFISQHSPDLLKDPRFLKALLATGGGAAAIAILIGSLGFGAAGILAGSPAALFQAAAYGGATPAAGWFAGATAAGMTGTLAGIQAGAAAVGGTVAGGTAWLFGKQH